MALRLRLFKPRFFLAHQRHFSQSTATMAPIIDTLKGDHRDIENYYNRIINASDKDEATRYQNQFTWELARHSIGEELVVYPAFEKYVPKGAALADKDRQEHQTVSSYYTLLPDQSI